MDMISKFLWTVGSSLVQTSYGMSYDCKVLYFLNSKGIRRTVNLGENAPSFQRLGAKLNPTPFPTCANETFRSDEYWTCLARHCTLTVFHFVGTVSMGRPYAHNSVVDSELRVIGTNRLRVIDASVMPYIVNVNTNAASIMIGERGADFIKEEWRWRKLFNHNPLHP